MMLAFANEPSFAAYVISNEAKRCWPLVASGSSVNLTLEAEPIQVGSANEPQSGMIFGLGFSLYKYRGWY